MLIIFGLILALAFSRLGCSLGCFFVCLALEIFSQSLGVKLNVFEQFSLVLLVFSLPLSVMLCVKLLATQVQHLSVLSKTSISFVVNLSICTLLAGDAFAQILEVGFLASADPQTSSKSLLLGLLGLKILAKILWVSASFAICVLSLSALIETSAAWFGSATGTRIKDLLPFARLVTLIFIIGFGGEYLSNLFLQAISFKH